MPRANRNIRMGRRLVLIVLLGYVVLHWAYLGAPQFGLGSTREMAEVAGAGASVVLLVLGLGMIRRGRRAGSSA